MPQRGYTEVICLTKGPINKQTHSYYGVFASDKKRRMSEANAKDWLKRNNKTLKTCKESEFLKEQKKRSAAIKKGLRAAKKKSPAKKAAKKKSPSKKAAKKKSPAKKGGAKRKYSTTKSPKKKAGAKRAKTAASS